MPIVPFDPGRHEAFVVSALAQGAGERRDTYLALMGAGARCAVRVGESNPDLFYGWALVTGPQRVAWCYTKGRLRGCSTMRLLLEHLGIDLTKPIQAHWQSPACDALIRRGWPITYLEAPGERRKTA